MPSVVVRAPATSANLGPGFDCLGLALDLWNEVAASPAERTSVETTDGSAAPPRDEDLVLAAARALFELAEAPVPALALRCTNRVPLGRGLGSSAAAIACGLLLANRWLGDPLSRPDLLALATRIEGHPDNVTPSLFGGVQASGLDARGGVLRVRVPLAAPLTAALFVPDVTLSTELARKALPSMVPFADALFNVGRASLLVAALASGDRGALREATRDRLHQPYRAALFPAGPRIVEAALEAGGLGSFISGAGPSVLALCESAEHARPVADAMALAARRHGVTGAAMVLPITERGAHVVDGD